MKTCLLYIAFAVVLFAGVANASTIDIVGPPVYVNLEEKIHCIVLNLSPGTYNMEVLVGKSDNNNPPATFESNGGDTVGQYGNSEFAPMPQTDGRFFCLFKVDSRQQVKAGFAILDRTTEAVRSYTTIK